MNLVKYDPKKHQGKQIYEMKPFEDGNISGISMQKSDVVPEVAALIPWQYFVDEGEK